MVDPGILHVDMDAFYASVEVLLDPSLAGRPVIVGGDGRRGVVAACTYEARVSGVRSAMSSVQARQLCPDAVWLAPRFEHYNDYSRRLHDVLGRFTPLVEGIALDEAFLDVTGSRRLHGTGVEIAWAIRATIASELGLAASVGVAATKFVAKLASEAAKPTADRRGVHPGTGVFVVEPGEELTFLHPLPVRALWGVGPAVAERLQRFGVQTIGDLAAMPVDTLVAALGPAVGQHLHDLAWARDPRAVEPHRPIKSVSHEETYAYDLHDHATLATEALRMADSVADRLRRAGLTGRTVTVKVRFHDFATITRSQTLPDPVDTTPVIARTATALLAQIDPTPGVRLLGVGVSNLSEGAARQLSLLSSDGDWDGAAGAVDQIRDRFGAGAVGLLGTRKPRPPGG